MLVKYLLSLYDLSIQRILYIYFAKNLQETFATLNVISKSTVSHYMKHHRNYLLRLPEGIQFSTDTEVI